jgi:predicted Zn-dependent protease
MKWCIAIFALNLCSQTLTSEKERALGRGLAEEYRRRSGFFANAAAEEYVQRIGARLAAAVPGEAFRFELAGPGAAEPLGLPGGTVLVPAAFFLRAADEDEFAGMVSHAMGHIVLRHGSTATRPAAEGPIPLIFLGGWISVHSDPAGAQDLVPLAYRARHQRYEREADQYAVQLAQRAGFDPEALRRYSQRRQTTSGPSEFARVRELVRAELSENPKKPSLRSRQ